MSCSQAKKIAKKIGVITRNDGIDYLVFRDGMLNTAEIFDIAVNSIRGKGIGTDMLKELESVGYSTIYAFTRMSNLLARGFYLKNGFSLISTIPDFYNDSDPNGAMYLWRK